MSYPRNAATPKAFTVGPLVKVADGTLLAVTTGVNVRYQLDSGGWGAGGGTIAVDATGSMFTYAPAQAETNGDVLNVVLYIAGYVSVGATILMDPIGLPAVAAGANGGLLIAGSNAATTFATLTVTAAMTNGSTVLGNVTAGTLTQTGAASWGATTLASMAITGALSVGTTTTLTGNVTLSGTLGTGAVTFASMAITGAASVGTTTTLTGAVSLGSTLVVTGTTTHTGAITYTNGINAGAVTGSGFSTLTQTQVSGGAYDLTNATFVGAFKTAIGKVPATMAAGDGVDSAALLTATGVR